MFRRWEAKNGRLIQAAAAAAFLVLAPVVVAQDAATQQVESEMEKARQEIDSLNLLALASNLRAGQARLERLSRSKLAQRDPAIMRRIKLYQGELAYQQAGIKRDQVIAKGDYIDDYQHTQKMIAARSRFLPPDSLQSNLDECELAIAAEQAELWTEALQHREINIRSAQSADPTCPDHVVNAMQDRELTVRLSQLTKGQRADYWEARSLLGFRLREQVGQTKSMRLSRAVRLLEDCLGCTSREYGLATRMLGDSYKEANDIQAAHAAYQTALTTLTKCLGESHEETLATKARLDHSLR